MEIELAVLVIHGMGSQRPDYAEGMKRELIDRVVDLKRDANKIAWRSVFWADILEKRQLKYLRDADRSGNLDFKSLRKFVLTALGDVCAYQKVKSDANTTYEDIHQRVRNEIKALYESDLAGKPKPLIVLAHSLGGHIMSNYIWDVQRSKNKQLSPFERLDYLSGIVTFGCNIPLFTFAYEKVEPIAFPPPGLPAVLKKKAKWLNFYDPNDVLAYPLKPINRAYSEVVTKDLAINVGGIISSWNPMSHSQYWTDNDFTKPLAKYLAEFLN